MLFERGLFFLLQRAASPFFFLQSFSLSPYSLAATKSSSCSFLLSQRAMPNTVVIFVERAVKNDTAKGMGTGWERFDFNMEAPLDDEEIEVAEDDAVLVKDMGQSFRFSAVEAKREAEIKAAHDQAMFGAPAALPIHIGKEPLEDKDVIEVKNENAPGRNLISNKVLAIQQGSWRDRARKLNDG